MAAECAIRSALRRRSRSHVHFDRPVRIVPLIKAPDAIPDTTPSSMYNCLNPLCDAHAPCEDPGFNNAAFSECGCALRTTVYLPIVDNGPCPLFSSNEVTQCSSTGLISSTCDPLCTEFVKDGCETYVGATFCPSVPPYANFYYDYPAPYLASWQDVPFNPDAGASTPGAVRCSATGRCGKQ